MRTVWVSLVMLGLGGCFAPVEELQAGDEPDANVAEHPGARDAGVPGTPDAGIPDAGTPDAGRLDAGSTDAGSFNPLGAYTFTFECTSNCTGTWIHQLDLTAWDSSTGAISGTGFMPSDPRYTWVMSGRIVGIALSMTLVYTGLNAGYQSQVTGVTNAWGEPIRGTASTSFNQAMSWTATRLP